MLKKLIIKPLILFLLLSQFATMAHALEHQFAEEEHEYCSICIHQNNSNNLLFQPSHLISDFKEYEKITNKSYSFYSVVRPDNNSARSPPSLLI